MRSISSSESSSSLSESRSSCVSLSSLSRSQPISLLGIFNFSMSLAKDRKVSSLYVSHYKRDVKFERKRLAWLTVSIHCNRLPKSCCICNTHRDDQGCPSSPKGSVELFVFRYLRRLLHPHDKSRPGQRSDTGEMTKPADSKPQMSTGVRENRIYSGRSSI